MVIFLDVFWVLIIFVIWSEFVKQFMEIVVEEVYVIEKKNNCLFLFYIIEYVIYCFIIYFFKYFLNIGQNFKR